MAEREPETPVIDSLVDEVLRGTRVVPFPPGTIAFVAANMTFLIGAALLCAASMPALLKSLVPIAAAAQLIGLGLVLPSLFVPAFLIVSGHAAGHRSFVRVCQLWLAASVVATLAAAAGILAAPLATCGIAGALLAVAWGVSRTAGHRSFALWKRKLRERSALHRAAR